MNCDNDSEQEVEDSHNDAVRFSESSKPSTTEVLNIRTKKKTNAEKCKECLERKKLERSRNSAQRSDECHEERYPLLPEKKKPKTNAEKCKKYRERKKLERSIRNSAQRSDECHELLPEKKKPKTNAEKCKEYRKRKKSERSRSSPQTSDECHKEIDPLLPEKKKPKLIELMQKNPDHLQSRKRIHIKNQKKNSDPVGGEKSFSCSNVDIIKIEENRVQPNSSDIVAAMIQSLENWNLKKCGEIFTRDNKIFYYSCLICCEQTENSDSFGQHMIQHHNNSMMDNNSNNNHLIEKSSTSDIGENGNEGKKIIEDDNEYYDESNLGDSSEEDKPLSSIKKKSEKSSQIKNEMNDQQIIKNEIVDFDNSKNSLNQGDFECRVCYVSFNHRSVLNFHMRKHRKKMHQCTFCAKVFERDSKRIYHEVVHTEIKNFVCDQCGFKFALKESLNQHVKLHLNAREFVCHECGRGFNTKQRLREHSETHFTTNYYHCDVCQAKLKTYKCFQKHKLTHTKIGPHNFKCDNCLLTFATRSAQSSHQRLSDCRTYWAENVDYKRPGYKRNYYEKAKLKNIEMVTAEAIVNVVKIEKKKKQKKP